MKAIVKLIWTITTLILVGLALLNYRNSSNRKKMELNTLLWMKQNFVQKVDPCIIENNELELVVQSIDSITIWSLSGTIEEGYNIVNTEMGQLFLVQNYKQVNFKKKILTLYESDTIKYKFLDDKLNFQKKYWFDEHYHKKTLIEILIELQQLKSELICSCYALHIPKQFHN